MSTRGHGQLDLHTARSTARKRAPTPPTDPLSDLDTQLMMQVREGNRDAANTLIRRNHDRVTRYIARLLGSSTAADDLAQDVFLQALRNAHRYEPTARVVTWLYRIATNCTLNYMKKSAQQRGLQQPPGNETVDQGVPGPDAKVSLDELRARVVDAIAMLPPKQRAAVTLFQYEGCSYEQIATILEITVEAVRSLLLRARAALRQRLQPYL